MIAPARQAAEASKSFQNERSVAMRAGSGRRMDMAEHLNEYSLDAVTIHDAAMRRRS
jgi:hypothetical protein